MRTLSADRQIHVAPGESVEVEVRVPNTFSWDIFRYGQEKFSGSAATELGWLYRKLGIGKPGPAIPPAGFPMPIPAQLNGDAWEPNAKFKIHAPDYSVDQLAHPNSLAVSLARDSALLEGKSPLISDQQLVARMVPDEAPKILENTETAQRVRTPFLSLRRLDQALTHRQFKATTERISEILAGTQGVTSPADLTKMASRDLTVGKVFGYLTSQPEQVEKHFGRRVLQHGVPLAAGIGTLFAGEALADRIGLDREADREIRFALMMYLGHGVHSNLEPLWEVLSNRILKHPYDFVRTRSVRIASEVLAQWSFSHYASLPRAMGASWHSGALALEAGVGQSLWRMGGKALMIPLRGAWNMGHGLIFSRLTEGVLDTVDAPATLKDYAPPAAFFAPELGRIVFPKATIGMMNHRGIQLGARIFAAGFIADMAFAGWQHAEYADHTQGERRTNQLAAQLRRRDPTTGLFDWRHGLRILSPTLADHVDSHEYGFGRPNVYHRMAGKI
jgi:hypothetical protein